jgi:hypothetical protein
MILQAFVSGGQNIFLISYVSKNQFDEKFKELSHIIYLIVPMNNEK